MMLVVIRAESIASVVKRTDEKSVKGGKGTEWWSGEQGGSSLRQPSVLDRTFSPSVGAPNPCSHGHGGQEMT